MQALYRVGAAMLLIFSARTNAGTQETLTRRLVVDELKDTAAQWKQIDELREEARAKGLQARSATLPSFQLISRQYFARFDGIRYGLPEFIEASPVLAGSTGLELLWMPVDFSSFSRTEAASLNEEASGIQAQHLHNDLSFLALYQFLTVQKLEHRRGFTDAALERAQEILKIARARIKSGVGLELDVMRAEGLLAAEELRKMDLGTLYLKARDELGATLGRSLVDIKIAPLDYREFAASEDKNGENSGPPDNQEIRATQTLVRASRALVESARRESWPKLTLLGEIGYLGARSFLGLGPSSLNGSIAMQISIPIYSGGRIEGKVREEESRLRKAELQLEHLRLQAKTQRDVIASQLRVANIAVRTVEQQVKAAHEELRLTTRRFRLGTASGMEVRTAHANLAAAHDTETEALFAYEAAKLQYFKVRSDVPGYLEASP